MKFHSRPEIRNPLPGANIGNALPNSFSDHFCIASGSSEIHPIEVKNWRVIQARNPRIDFFETRSSCRTTQQPQRQIQPRHPAKMDIPWTDPSTIPEKLYRVICPNQNTYYDPKNGLIAAMTLPSGKLQTHSHHLFLPLNPIDNSDAKIFSSTECWISGTDLPLFHHSIRCHREQEKIPSPYISLFEDLSEAEIYCIAASDFHQDINGDKCFIIEIDTIHHNMRSIRPWLWFVHDIQVMCPKGVQLGEGPEDNLAAESQKGGRFDSEWLCLYAVPGVKGMKILKGSKQCRIGKHLSNLLSLHDILG